MNIKEIKCKSFINRMNDAFFAIRYLPFRYTSNPYRGCSHGCVYCYAAHSHYYLKSSPDLFSEVIYVKKNCAEILDIEFRKFEKAGRKSVLIIGNTSDAYQPIEMKYRLTRQILNTCLKHHYPCFIETKSSLILEDIDLIEKLAKEGLIGVGMTVTSYDDKFIKLTEPYVPRKKYFDSGNSTGYLRILTLKELASVGVDTYLHITPYFPLITEKDLEQIVKDASVAKVRSIIMAPLELTQYIQNRLNATFNNSQYAYLISQYNKLYLKYGRRLGARITTSEQEHFKAEQKLSKLCEKYNVQYWAFTNLQFNSTSREHGIYKWGYPILLDYYRLIQKKEEISLKDANLLAKNFSVDDKYLVALEKYWMSGELFKGIYGVKKIQRGDKVKYSLVKS